MDPGSIIAQKYRLEAPLARGGMGAVWIARHVTLGHEVAVKFLDPRLAGSAAFVARFEREARAAATIQSPHIVRVYDFGVDEGTPYIVMELLQGEDLRTRIKRVGRLSLGVSAALLVQVGKGLRRAHEAGIVHRDVKPGNLFLARFEDEEVVKILDFGIAKEPDKTLDEHTKTGELVGSPHYVSPEQARCEKDLDHRSDVWSSGVITYRMVTGHLPFPGEGIGQVLSKVLTADPPRVGTIVPGLPPSLDDFFARALAKKKEERFQSMRELCDAFVELVREEGADDSVPPPSWSTIVSVSVPPPAAVPADMAELRGGSQGLLDLVPSATGTATPPTPSRDVRRDSLVPSMALKLPQPPPVVRFRWAAAAAIGLSAAVTVGVAWYRDRAGTTRPSASVVETGTAPTATPISLPASFELPAAAPPSTGPLPTTVPSASPTPAGSPYSTSTSSARNMIPPVPSNAPQARPTGAVEPSSAPIPTGTKRKWGF